MLILKCTQKVAQELGFKRATLPEIPPTENPTLLGDWFVNALRFGRTKVLLFVNAPTLYSLLIPGYKKKELTDIGQLFKTNLRLNWLVEGFEPAKIEWVLNEYQAVILAKTDSRSILGSMNDLAWLYQVEINYQEAGVIPQDMSRVMQSINRTPQLTRGGRYSIDLVKERFLTIKER